MRDRLIGPDLFAVLFADFRVVAGDGVRAPGDSDQVGRRGDQGQGLPASGGFGGYLAQGRRAIPLGLLPAWSNPLRHWRFPDRPPARWSRRAATRAGIRERRSRGRQRLWSFPAHRLRGGGPDRRPAPDPETGRRQAGARIPRRRSRLRRRRRHLNAAIASPSSQPACPDGRFDSRRRDPEPLRVQDRRPVWRRRHAVVAVQPSDVHPWRSFKILRNTLPDGRRGISSTNTTRLSRL